MLIIQGWFTQIEMYFLTPGHTHGDVDRMFYRFGHLRKEINCDTPEDFLTKWKKLAFRNQSKTPEFKFVRFVYDWKRYFGNSLHQNTQGHSRPRAFLFKKNEQNGIVQFWVKESALATSWIGRTDDQLHGWEILFAVPTGLVSIIRPVPLEEHLYADVRKTYKWLSPDARIWWDQFFDDQFFWLPDEEEPPRGNVWDIVLPNVVDIPTFHEAPVVINIQMRDHPPSSLDELTIGELVAVLPPDVNAVTNSSDDETVDVDLEENIYDDDYDDDDNRVPRVQNLNVEGHPFWIGKVIGFTVNANTRQRKVLLRYYKRRGNTEEDRMYELHESRGTCVVESILLNGFKLTTTGLLRSVTMRSLARILHL